MDEKKETQTYKYEKMDGQNINKQCLAKYHIKTHKKQNKKNEYYNNN